MTRTLLVLACLVLFAVCLAGMRRGWRNRGRRQGAVPALPVPPSDLGPVLLAPMTGLYVGTTTAGQWQDRVVAHGLGVRADATAELYTAGVLIERAGAEPLFVPTADLVGAGVGAGLAGKVLGPGGLLLIRWRLGAIELDTGFRADDKSLYPAWVNAIDERRATVIEQLEDSA